MNSLQKYGVPFVFALLSGIIFSCDRHKTAQKELDEATFRAVLVDAFMAEAFVQEASSYRQFNAASLMNRRIYPFIFEKHGVDSAAFSNTFDHYLHRPDEFREVLARVNDTLNVLLKLAPLSENPPPPAPVPDEISSDTALAEDAMNRFRLMQKIREGQAQGDKNSN